MTLCLNALKGNVILYSLWGKKHSPFFEYRFPQVPFEIESQVNTP
jgi:hypothetical protein